MLSQRDVCKGDPGMGHLTLRRFFLEPKARVITVWGHKWLKLNLLGISTATFLVMLDVIQFIYY